MEKLPTSSSPERMSNATAQATFLELSLLVKNKHGM
jgi:hypothetical protein